jgi:hypothetical protein
MKLQQEAIPHLILQVLQEDQVEDQDHQLYHPQILEVTLHQKEILVVAELTQPEAAVVAEPEPEAEVLEVMAVQEALAQLIQQQDHLSLMVAEVAEESVTQVLEEQEAQAEAVTVDQVQELQDHQVQLTPEAVEVDQDIVQHLTLWDME